MEHIQKRHKKYYYRVSIPKVLKEYFEQKNIYTKSLNTSNKEEAKILVKHLNAKLNFIKSQIMLLSGSKIQELIEEFKNDNSKTIISRNSHLSVREIDKLIKHYRSPIKASIDDKSLENELKDLSSILIKKNIDSLIDTDSSDIDILVDNIVNIKLNILNDLKTNLNKNINHNIVNTVQTIVSDDKPKVKLEVTIEEFLKTKEQTKSTYQKYKYYLALLSTYCKDNNISNIEDIGYNHILQFRDNYLIKQYKNKNTINQVLTHIITFFNYTVKCEYRASNPATDTKLKLSVNEKVNNKRESFKDEDIKKVFDNINLLTTNQRTNKPNKYSKEYEIIIKIALYSGMRENEILQLTKDDIQRDNDIYFFSLNVNDDKNIKNTHSIRQVPIHPTIKKEILEYIKDKPNNLFTINQKQFGKDFSKFKTKLGFTNKLVFHSFRHTVSNKLKQALVDPTIIDEITGHAHSTSSMSLGRYANKYNIGILYSYLEKLEYDI